MIAIIDYGAGNIKSLQFALERLDIPSELTSDRTRLEQADALILPGVGAFGDAMKQLKATGLDEVVKAEVAKGKPLLGICLGMQMLFETSEEGGRSDGLGLLKGNITLIPDTVKVPHMGWNSLTVQQDKPILKDVTNGDYVYFVHSYYAADTDNNDIVADADYEVSVPAVVQKGNTIGIQFHPEKSGETGLQILKNFGGMFT
ncbi:imidazole glycerol phosphate synthase subunit HisH [Aciduricibacillus chroicocephali]|uniref:Imidazole glycerol phosphate synthase subunit HisH n=1 Tax=Aciduricibacillus chroicocephali TaxID=3054939 RepID=A0ABY9KW56_9BACI|nr:imidazole glycerol phosphate synthase subunit HisH [Bacillaceae bacterium 44XB]